MKCGRGPCLSVLQAKMGIATKLVAKSKESFMTMLDTVIVGGGQAGLGVSYFLQQNGHKHILFERGRIGESWLSQRWDSFRLNTPNLRNTLPGLLYDGPQPDGFSPIDSLVDYFQNYVDCFQLPVRTGVNVLSVEWAEDQ